MALACLLTSSWNKTCCLFHLIINAQKKKTTLICCLTQDDRDHHFLVYEKAVRVAGENKGCPLSCGVWRQLLWSGCFPPPPSPTLVRSHYFQQWMWEKNRWTSEGGQSTSRWNHGNTPMEFIIVPSGAWKAVQENTWTSKVIAVIVRSCSQLLLLLLLPLLFMLHIA